MSFDTISLVYDPAIENGVDYLDVFHIFGRHLYRQSWEVWQKYAALLPMKGYSLISFPSPMSDNISRSPSLITIYLLRRFRNI